MNRRMYHTPRVYRKVATNPQPVIHTIDGAKEVLVHKHCQSCKTVQPLDNFYFISESKLEMYGYEETDPRSRENICAVCWDRRKSLRRKVETNTVLFG